MIEPIQFLRMVAENVLLLRPGVTLRHPSPSAPRTMVVMGISGQTYQLGPLEAPMIDVCRRISTSVAAVLRPSVTRHVGGARFVKATQ